MKLPRDIGGAKLAGLLRRYGYEITHQTGSHLRLTSKAKAIEHHITIPAHKQVKIGTHNSIVSDVASYLERQRSDWIAELFGR